MFRLPFLALLLAASLATAQTPHAEYVYTAEAMTLDKLYALSIEDDKPVYLTVGDVQAFKVGDAHGMHFDKLDGYASGVHWFAPIGGKVWYCGTEKPAKKMICNGTTCSMQYVAAGGICQGAACQGASTCGAGGSCNSCPTCNATSGYYVRGAFGRLQYVAGGSCGAGGCSGFSSWSIGSGGCANGQCGK